MLHALRVLEKLELEIVAPFSVEFHGRTHTFQVLIKEFGAPKGMIVDKDWSKIESVESELVSAGYGYSCFDIEKVTTPEMMEALEDWGTSN